MLNHRFLLLAAGALTLAGCSSKTDSPRKAIVGATLIDGSGGPAIPDSAIVIDGGRITAAGPQSSTKVPEGYDKISGSGKFVIPGLVDVRVKIDPDAEKAKAEMLDFVSAGITAVGAETQGTGSGPHVFPVAAQTAGVADLVIASGGTGPEATLAKMERMAKAEIAPIQVLQAATRNGANWLQQSNLGGIKAGQLADLVMLNADPVADIKNVRQIYRVMRDGQWVVKK